MVNTAANIAKVIKENQGKGSQFASIILKAISPMGEIMAQGKADFAQLEGLLDPTKIKETLISLKAFRDEFDKIGETKKAEAFDVLVKQLLDTRKQLERVTKKTGDFSKQFDMMRKKINEKKIVPILDIDTIKRQLEELEFALAGTDTGRAVTIQKELDILNQNVDILDKTLKTKKKTLEIEAKTLQATEQRSKLESSFAININKMKLAGATNLQILQTELAFMEKLGDSEDKLLKKRTDIAIERQNMEKNVTESMLNLQLGVLEAEGKSKLQVMLARIELEKKLGIKKTEIELIKQQLDLQKAITEENKKTGKEKLDALKAAIIEKNKEARAESVAGRFAQRAKEFKYSQRATEAGMTQAEIDAYAENVRTSFDFDLQIADQIAAQG